MVVIGRCSRAERIEDSVLSECDRIRLVVPDDPYVNYPRLDTELEVRLLWQTSRGVATHHHLAIRRGCNRAHRTLKCSTLDLPRSGGGLIGRHGP